MLENVADLTSTGSMRSPRSAEQSIIRPGTPRSVCHRCSAISRLLMPDGRPDSASLQRAFRCTVTVVNDVAMAPQPGGQTL